MPPTGEDFWRQVSEGVAADAIRITRQKDAEKREAEKKKRLWKAAALFWFVTFILSEVNLWAFPKFG